LRFSLTIGVILLVFSALFSVLLYTYLKAQVIRNAEEKTMILMTQVEAMGGYVSDTLRPKMFEVLSKNHSVDNFIVEAMSATHINLQVIKRFNKGLPQYVYKRVSDRPINSENMADTFHLGMMESFAKNPGQEKWQGIVKLDGEESLVYARPIMSNESCLKCHGDKERVPKRLLAKYGALGRFGWKAGALVGVESIHVPLSLAMADVRKVAWDTFLFGIFTLGFLFLAFYVTFRQVVSMPLNKLADIFTGISKGTEPLGKKIPADRNDEIGDLTESFNTLARHLLDAEEKLRQTSEIEIKMMTSEKLAALGQLSAGVAHEINNPLGGIKLCFNNLIETPMDDETRKEHIEVINAGFDRIQNTVGQLLDYSKNSRLAMEHGSICKIVGNVLKLVEYTISKKGITLEKELVGDIPDIVMDANKMEQVFLNLLINAVQATKEGGVVSVKTGCDGVMCSVSIANTGRPIPEEILSRIFDPFFTTKDVGEGTGLGLTVSKSIVEQHKGVIEVSTNDAGTNFTVKLPVA
jgi:signal transduction histidine kinase